MGFHNTPSNRNFIVIIVALIIAIVLLIIVLVRQSYIIELGEEEMVIEAQELALASTQFDDGEISDILVEEGTK